jgi:hypothetical protein
MRSVYKFKLDPRYPSEVAIQPGYKVLSVKAQGDDVVLYALVGPKREPTATLMAYVLPTGAMVELPKAAHFVDTVMFGDGALVFHVFVSEVLFRGGRCTCGIPIAFGALLCDECWADAKKGGEA